MVEGTEITPMNGEVSKVSSESMADDTSTKATEENDSDSTMDTPLSSDEKNDDEDEDDDTSKDNRTQEEKDKEAKEKEEAEKQRIKELKEKYKDWPLKGVKDPHENDVMYGRGGGTNHHPGNKRYRKMVEDRKIEYVNSKRLDKPLVALAIIREWRAQLPPGRFLKINDKTGLWDDVGDKKAREKTSQALREKAPQIRKQQEEEKMSEENTDISQDKTTRFAEGTKENKGSTIKKAILARDHSLGREYLASDENVDLEGFTWQDPFKKGNTSRETSIGSIGSFLNAGQGTVLPPARENSMGSMSMPYSRGPPPPDYYGRVYSGEPRREYSTGSIGSWGGGPYYPPGPPPPGAPTHQRSGSWTHPHQPPSPHQGAHHRRSGSWTGREHSFVFNPLPGANVSRPAPAGAFEPRGSGVWGGEHAYPPGPQHGPYPPPQLPPPPGPYGGLGYQSGSSMGTIASGAYRQLPSPSHSNSPASPPFNVMNIAKTWSGGGHTPPEDAVQAPFGGHSRPSPSSDTSPSRGRESQFTDGSIPRPGLVKRDTSHQNETYESKPNRIKRAALNRDQSATSNRLKKEYIPEVFNRDMQSLQKTTEQIRLSSPVPDRPKPEPLSQDGRMTTIEAIADCFGDSSDNLPPKPVPLDANGRMSTVEALGFIVDSQTEASLPCPKPPALTEKNRLSTTDIFALADATLGDDKPLTDDNEEPLPL